MTKVWPERVSCGGELAGFLLSGCSARGGGLGGRLPGAVVFRRSRSFPIVLFGMMMAVHQVFQVMFEFEIVHKRSGAGARRRSERAPSLRFYAERDRVRAAFAARRLPAAPFVRTASRAAARRLAPPRRRALAFECLERASCDAADEPSRFKARLEARERVGLGLRCVALVSFTPGRDLTFTPARRALESPIAMACLAERAPCLPSRMCSISSRTYSPALLDWDLARRARSRVLFSGMITAHRRRARSWIRFSPPNTAWLRSA